MKVKVYLAGPINGKTDAECNDWRDQIRKLAPEFEYLDPMMRDYRGKEDQNVDDIVIGDKLDIQGCNFVIANARVPSAGTSMEILYAYLCMIPVFSIVGEKVSPWVRYHSKEVVTDEQQVCDALRNFIRGSSGQ